MTYTYHLITRELILIEPAHSRMDSLLYPFIRIGQFHQQTCQRDALHRAIGGQLKGTGRCRLQCLTIVLLTPNRELTIFYNLCRQDAIDTLIKGFCHAFP